MALQKTIQGSTARGQRVTWTYADGSAPDLRAATITGRLRKQNGGNTRAITGTLVPDVAVGNRFVWTYSAADVATSGWYEVQFTATYPDGTVERTFPEPWEVQVAL